MIDEIVAIVETTAIPLSDLYLEARIMAARRDGGAAFLVTPEPRALKEALQHRIDEQVVKQEAEGLQVFTVSPEEIDQGFLELRQLVGVKPFEQFLTEKQIDDASIREIIDRSLRAKRYLEGRFHRKAIPTDAEVSAWYAAHPAEFAGQTLTQAKDAIRTRLTQQNLERLSTDFTNDVRSRAHIRILHDPAQPNADVRLSGTAHVPQPSVDAGQG